MLVNAIIVSAEDLRCCLSPRILWLVEKPLIWLSVKPCIDEQVLSHGRVSFLNEHDEFLDEFTLPRLYDEP